MMSVKRKAQSNPGQDIYGKIEKRIVNLKEKEEFWKAKYGEMEAKVKELVDSNAQKMSEMALLIRKLEAKLSGLEEAAKQTDSRNKEMFTLADKRIAKLSDLSKGLSGRLEGRDEDVKRLKAEFSSQLDAVMKGHEKNIDAAVAKIDDALSKVQAEARRAEAANERSAVAREQAQSYSPPPPRQMFPQMDDPPMPAVSQMPPPPPMPQRAGSFPTQFFYDERQARMKRPAPLLDDDLDDIDDVDEPDIAPGKMADFKNSMETMSTSARGINEKLAAIEQAFAKMQAEKGSDVMRLEDKMRLYAESVADSRGRMEALERALKDGMTPMMETMRALADTVRSMKEEQKPAKRPLEKPKPPTEPKRHAQSLSEGPRYSYKPRDS